MGVKPPYSSRTAGQAFRKINRFGRVLRNPEYIAAQKALAEEEEREREKTHAKNNC